MFIPLLRCHVFPNFLPFWFVRLNLFCLCSGAGRFCAGFYDGASLANVLVVVLVGILVGVLVGVLGGVLEGVLRVGLFLAVGPVSYTHLTLPTKRIV